MIFSIQASLGYASYFCHKLKSPNLSKTFTRERYKRGDHRTLRDRALLT